MHNSFVLFAGFASAMPVFNTSPSIADAGIPAVLTSPSIAGFRDPTIHPSRGGKSICVSGLVNVVGATTHNFQVRKELVPLNQTAVTALMIEAFIPGNAAQTPKLESVNQTFEIATTLCMPADATTSPPKTVQFLTHGAGLDGYYWDFAPGYSYVDVAVGAGHSVLFYDRLGQGNSEHPDPRIVQAPLELELAHEMVSLLRAGNIGGTAFSKVVGVGHSYGSGITEGLNVYYPTLFDASILTGFGTNSTIGTTMGFDLGCNPTVASAVSAQRFGDLPAGYFACQSAQGVQIDFFSYPGFDPAILAQTFEQQGVSPIGSMLGGSIGGVATNYTNPLAVVNGMNDYPYCTGNCSYPTDQAALVQPKFYPNVKAEDFGSFLVPNAGHGFNLHFSAGEGYTFIQNFLKSHDI
ncbi:hypothetical protein K431DRAFT_276534 [Polychaeton citri CBS 116435]|uniref:AB hydrolase-1 domain-containing protein n=1 Tax=Polychaeton citri CBS 116435 TaxID=1314669 RepID=A0A9P4Q167_9PEZI|nr:hypothetical protein K431DRAFT_276534 [Polychaeton citri CBS 116435]